MTLSDAGARTSPTGRARPPTTPRSRSPCRPGRRLLNASIAWPATAAEPPAPEQAGQARPGRPGRQLAAHSLPQGVGGYGSAQVLHPAAGTWTAEIFSDTAKAGGTAGTVRFGASVARTASFGVGVARRR